MMIQGVILLLLMTAPCVFSISAPSPPEEDQHESCFVWSSVGECAMNPHYMLKSCAKSCFEYKRDNPLSHYLSTWHSFFAKTPAIASVVMKMMLFENGKEVFLEESRSNTSDDLLIHVKDLDGFDIIPPDETAMNRENLRNEYGFEVNGIFRGISYYYVKNDTISSKILSYVKPSFRSSAHVSLMRITAPFIPPHTDSDVGVSVNFYVITHGAVTSFYNPRKGARRKLIEGQTDGGIWEEEESDKIHSFTAKDKEVWILNTKRVHSVRMVQTEEEDNIRIAYNLVFPGTTFSDFSRGHMRDSVSYKWSGKSRDDEL